MSRQYKTLFMQKKYFTWKEQEQIVKDYFKLIKKRKDKNVKNKTKSRVS